MRPILDRRDFLRTTAVASAGVLLSQGSLSAQPKSPNEKLNIGIIGGGGKGSSNLSACDGENIVAICDVDFERAAKAFKRFPGAKQYKDFRRMLDEEKLDAVVVSTPDHTHAIASLLAMRQGKHVYCEKPLTWSIQEARLMTETARKMKVATQMGNQGTSTNGLRTAVEVVQAGIIGPVKEAHVWTNRPIWPQGMTELPKGQPVPDHLAWELWLGGASERPYNKAYLPFSWRGWWDFGTGALGDMACHTANMAFMALKLGAPQSVVAESEGNTPISPPKKAKITYQFPARGEGYPELTLYWYEGGRVPPQEVLPGVQFKNSGSLLVGEKGILYSPNDYGADFKLFPEEQFKDVKMPEPSLPRSSGHHKEWLIACKGGPAAMSNFDYAGPLTEFVLLGNVALRLGNEIIWDSKKLQAKGCPEAQPYIFREYRKGWEIEG